jgi:hypothetical protein
MKHTYLFRVPLPSYQCDENFNKNILLLSTISCLSGFIKQITKIVYQIGVRVGCNVCRNLLF